ncbi:hypothetical protein [Halobacillus litoralis]|uniref:hypothetical protein n=1 Tax=Halobacillus litoralis TaxID=45668 RepID=UPI002490E22E|nr:hypothetical protein [Halobacillus litoralis]
MNIEEYIHEFFSEVSSNKVDIYNEFSLQHELGIFLRNKVPNPYKVEFERNIRFFHPNAKCAKSEIDIVIYHPDNHMRYAIELKYPKNGQYPESMFHFVKDIKFMEQVKDLGFCENFAVTYVEDNLFYSGSKRDGIYGFFRNGELIHGEVNKPTGRKKESHIIEGTYKIEWLPLENDSKYYVLSI